MHHEVLSAVARLLGHHLAPELPIGLHFALHIVLLAMPLGLALVAGVWAIRLARSLARRRARRGGPAPAPRPDAALPASVFTFTLRYSRPRQVVLVIGGLLAMPVLYATLELPKAIINGAIESGHFPVMLFGLSLGQAGYLFTLCALFLGAILANGVLKYWLNVYKGRTGERLLRRLRLVAWSRWRRGAGGPDRTEVIPLIAQEVEPVGGFAADAFALPVFQGGTFLTILAFMFAQDPILGAAAITLLPVQLVLIPRLQRKVNRLARERVAAIRRLGGHIGAEIGGTAADANWAIPDILAEIESIRTRLHQSKYFMKALSNFLTALTPFFFYSIGGYLVIEGRLSLGALIAVLAAYKDFSAPLRELFRYYQTMEDVRVRYDEILIFLARPAAAEQPQRPDPFTPRYGECTPSDEPLAAVSHVRSLGVRA